MTRLNVLLLLAVIASAMFLVHTQYQSRQLFTELYRAQGEARQLEVDAQRLQVEKRAQSTPLRIEKLAKEQLKMTTATPAITLYVRPDGSVIPAVAPAPAASAPRPATAARRSKP